MTREQKIVEAKRLREKGLTYAAIAEALGYSSKTIQMWLKPKWALEVNRHSNAKRGPAKRAWADKNRAACPNCGAPMREGSKMPSHASRRCINCVRTEARERTERFIEMRKEGLLNPAIAEREGIAPCVVAIILSRAQRYGLTVPPSPWFKAGA